MTLKHRLGQLEKQAKSTAAGRRDYVASGRRFRAARWKWEVYFIAGVELPPFDHDGWHGGWPSLRQNCVCSAAVRARDEGIIGRHEYLPGMTEAEKAVADNWSVVFEVIDRTVTEDETYPDAPDQPENDWLAQHEATFGTLRDFRELYDEALAYKASKAAKRRAR